jgi:alpha,alpha-trehalose phosphorylase (configuration-retaining)
MDIVPIVFNIKPFHTDSLTKPNIKHRLTSTTGSSRVSGTHTPTVRMDQVPTIGVTDSAQVASKLPIVRTLDEQADSAARKCVCLLPLFSLSLALVLRLLDNVLWTGK